MSTRQRVLITGAARRIGRTIALELATAGYDLALHCRRSVAEAESVAVQARSLGVAADVFAADLADEAACLQLVPAVLAACGRLDAVVNNASHFDYDELADFTFDRLAQHLRINVGAALLLTRALQAHLQARGAQGCVVNLLDQKLDNPNPDYLSYTLSKAALAAATPMMAMALAPTLRVCAVSPGITLPSGPMSEAQFAQAHRMTPLARGSTPVDLARAVRFLLESPAITGATLLVDGGQHLLAQPRDVMHLSDAQHHE